MKIPALLKQKRTLSFEVFPPKEDKPLEPLKETLELLYGLEPDFISITYGAGGTNEGRSLEVANMVASSGHTAMPHFTCVGTTRSVIDERIGKYLDLGIENLLLLRGDLPEGWDETCGDFAHANELIKFVHGAHDNIAIAAAAYPEVHIESRNIEEDVRYIRSKQDAGAEFLMTQLCHNATAYERFMARLDKAGVTIPVVVGVMPILSRDGTIRMTLSNGCSIPAELSAIIGRYKDNSDDFREAGKEFTARLIESYIAAGAQGLHIYTLNRYKDVADILTAVGLA